MTRQTWKRLMDRKIVELLLSKKSAREIMRQFKLGDRRVHKIRLLTQEYGYLDQTRAVALPPYPEPLFADGPDGCSGKGSEADSLILARKPWAQERPEVGWHPITVYEELGLPVGRSSFYRFLHRHGLYELAQNVRRVVPEIINQPGEAYCLTGANCET